MVPSSRPTTPFPVAVELIALAGTVGSLGVVLAGLVALLDAEGACSDGDGFAAVVDGFAPFTGGFAEVVADPVGCGAVVLDAGGFAEVVADAVGFGAVDCAAVVEGSEAPAEDAEAPVTAVLNPGIALGEVGLLPPPPHADSTTRAMIIPPVGFTPKL